MGIRKMFERYVNNVLLEILLIAYNDTLPHEQSFDEWAKCIIVEYTNQKKGDKN